MACVWPRVTGFSHRHASLAAPPPPFFPHPSLIVPLDQLERIARTTRTILKVPVLELLLKAEVSEQRMVYQFGTVANSSDVVAAVEKQIGNLRKDE